MSFSQFKELAWAISVHKHKNFYESEKHIKTMFQGSYALNDTETVSLLENLFKNGLNYNNITKLTNLDEFKENMHRWILSHQVNKISGLENFRSEFSTGSTQGFDSFYFRHREKKFRCLIGEYFYHLKNWFSNKVNWSWIDDNNPIKPGDAVILSIPFSESGSVHPAHNEILQQCEKLNVPVLIDCAYYPISGNTFVDLNYNCIDSVTFSLSKVFRVANLRIGIRYIKKELYDGQSLHDEINYNHSLSAYVGNKLIEKFPSDYIYKKYREKQLEITNYFSLEPSNSVIFGIGNSYWNYYNRAILLQAYKLNLDPALFNNRIYLGPIFENWHIWEKFKNAYSN